MAEHLLSVDSLTLRFGGIVALDDVSIYIPEGLIVGIIGPNGAGKTSLLNCLNGVYKPQIGSLTYKGEDVTALRPWDLALRGIGRTFQNIELVDEASVIENIMIGRHRHANKSLWAAATYWGRGRKEEELQRAFAEKVLDFLGLSQMRNAPCAGMPAGLRKLVEIGRALASEPDLLLLDEPTSGMTREEKEDVARFILRIKSELGISQVLVEHDIRFVSDLCDLIFVLDFGRVIAAGTPEEVMANEAVIEAYVGGH
jgi:branched-chain amino acid transport system ATP-binding protein